MSPFLGESWRSVDATIRIESLAPVVDQPWPNSLEEMQLWHCNSEPSQTEDIAWTKLDTQGWASSAHSTLFLQALKSTLSSPQRSSAVRLIFPASTGYPVRSDIFSLRMVDSECSKSAVSFFATQPGKVFAPPPPLSDITPQTVFNEAIGGVLLQSTLSAKERYEDDFLQLDAELTDRLSFEWLTDSPPERKTLALVEGGRSSPEHGGLATSLYTAAQALNIDIVVLDVPGHWLQGPRYAHWRKEFLEVQLDPPSLLADRILQVLSGYSQVDGLVTFCDSYQVAVANAARQLGLPYAPAEAYAIATDKYRTAVSEGRPAYLARGIEEALEITRRQVLDYPLIVKPCNGFLSEGVSKVVSEDELSRALSRVNSDRHGNEVVLEPYCDGPEVDINFVLANGDLVFCEVSDDFPKTADQPHGEVGEQQDQQHPRSFVELANIMPSNLPEDEINLLRESLHGSLTRLSLTTGVYHLEARVQHSSVEYRRVSPDQDELVDLMPRITSNASENPPSSWLIEINPRPPGIQETAAVESTYGVDYWGVALLGAVHDYQRMRALAQPFRQGPQYWSEIVFIPVSTGGTFDSDDVCEDLKKRRPDLANHISKCFCFFKRGDPVQAPETGITSWVAYYIVFSRTSRRHLLELTAAVRRETQFIIA